mgnify:CR=1 FL=1
MKISKKRLRELEISEEKLNALEAGGVDNWSGYEMSLEEFNNKHVLDSNLDSAMEDLESALLDGAYEPSERGAGFNCTEDGREEAKNLILKFIEDNKELINNNA